MRSVTQKMSYLLLLAATGFSGCGGDGPAAPPVEGPRPACPLFVEASAGLPEIGEWRTHPSIADVNLDGLGDIAALTGGTVADNAVGDPLFVAAADADFHIGAGSAVSDAGTNEVIEAVCADFSARYGLDIQVDFDG